MASKQLPQAKWWAVRRARNSKLANFLCPFCGRYLPSLSEHMLIAPEGDTSRRRHAHSKCVLAARTAGRLPTRDEWLKTQPREPGLWRRAVERMSGSARRSGG